MQLLDGSLLFSSSLGLHQGQTIHLSNEAWAVVLFLAQGTYTEASVHLGLAEMCYIVIWSIFCNL